jgi:4-amino-4-deoxy-L-arabinose transferase-like glycosyltransferase
MKASVRGSLALAALLGLALRLVFALAYWTNQPLTRDEREYLSLARSVAAGRGFVYDEAGQAGPADPFGRAPGYPVFLALTGGGARVTDSVPVSVKIAQSLVGAFGVVLVGVIASSLAGARAGRVAALIAACYPPLVWVAAYGFSEAIAWPLGLLAAWQFDRAAGESADDEAPRRYWLAGLACGVFAGLTALVRPASLFFLFVAGAWLVWRRRLALAVSLAIGACVAIGPWTIRNGVHYGRPVLIATEGGVTFWTGNHALARGEGDLAANPDLKRAQQTLRARYPDLSEEQMEPVYYREALAWIVAHPIDSLMLEGRKLFYLIVPAGPSYRVHSTRYFAASVVSYGLLLPVAIAGLWRLGSRAGRTPGVWLLGVSAIVVCLVFFPQERFRIPAIDPVLIIAAGSAFFGPASARTKPSVAAV